MSLTAGLDEAVARTPATRDRYVDFQRAASILVVVFGHWLSGMVYWEGGVIGTRQAIGVLSWGWILTWVLQVMPIFFFVGGFSNLVSWRSFRARGASGFDWLRSRLARLLVPSFVFLAAWAVIQAILFATDTGTKTTPFLRGMRPPGATVPFGPLWFLAVYAGVILLAPVMIRLHERLGLAVPVAMIAGAVAADAIGFVAGHPGARWANVVFTLFLPHQLGFFYADGRMTRLSRRALGVMAVAGLGALVLLTNPWIWGSAGDRWFAGIGHYPRSLLGTDVEPISNAYPPTVTFVAMSFWSIGVAMLLRERGNRWLRRRGPWRFTVFVNSVIMTLFLWHMTAFLLVILALHPLGLGRGSAAHVIWWLERPLWLILPAIVLTGIVAVFGRFERVRPKGPRQKEGSLPASSKRRNRAGR